MAIIRLVMGRTDPKVDAVRSTGTASDSVAVEWDQDTIPQEMVIAQLTRLLELARKTYADAP